MFSTIKKFIVFENNEFLIINKPFGLAVHGGTNIIKSTSLITILKCNIGHDVTLLHRLDRETSGCLIVSKKKKTLNKRIQLLNISTIKKIYYCIVGGLCVKKLKINIPLQKYSLKFNSFFMKDVITNIVPVKFLDNKYTVLKIIPLSGKMHQIRAHLAYLKYPIIGDDKYGNYYLNKYFHQLGLNRLFLHAKYVTFFYNKKFYMFKAPYDVYFKSFFCF